MQTRITLIKGKKERALTANQLADLCYRYEIAGSYTSQYGKQILVLKAWHSWNNSHRSHAIEIRKEQST